MKFKEQYHKSLKNEKLKQLKNNRLNQAVLAYFDKTNDIKAKRKAACKIKSWMIFHNFLYIMKEILIASVVLFISYQPYSMASAYIHTATIMPWHHISTGQLFELAYHAMGRYMLAVVIFGVALNWVIHLPWGQAPYHHISVHDFAKKLYPKIKEEAHKLKQ